MARKSLWVTAGGVLVEERRRKRVVGGTKVACYRSPTGGWHGWLWLHRLTFSGLVR